jgi:hypothetical protein
MSLTFGQVTDDPVTDEELADLWRDSPVARLP